ncbi:MAG: response regulator [Anaerolineae bacterium]|nr:response regulator [Anaerolineae bacterium]
MPDQRIKGLLVEDEATHARLFERNVRRLNIPFQFDMVSDGGAAVEYLKAHADKLSPDSFVLVLDLKLPVKNGFEVLEFMRGDARLRDLKVIVLTTSDDPHDVARASELGIKHHLIKPIDFEQFGNLLRQIMPAGVDQA